MQASPTNTGINEKLAQNLELLLLKRIQDDTLALPAMPAVATRVLEMLRRPDVGFREAATVLEQDPVLAARLLRTACSAAFAAGSKNITLTDAISRVGLKPLKTMLLEACAQTLFVSKNPKITLAAKELWKHSVAVGLLARDLTAVTGGTDSESAYLAGLLHDVGKPVVAAFLLEAERQISDLRGQKWIESNEWSEVVRRTHRKVGVSLVEKWNLPEPVCTSIRDCSEFDPSNRGSIANVVCLANALAKQAGVAGDSTDLDDAQALVMIGRSMLGVSEEVITSLTAMVTSRMKGAFE